MFYTERNSSKLIPDVYTFKPSVYNDERGMLWSLWDNSILEMEFNLDKVSSSRKDVFRGFHGDYKSHKFITCLHGELDFWIVDTRNTDSDGLFTTEYYQLKGDEPFSILIPPKVLNGFLVKSEGSIFHYKWSFEGDYPDVDQQISLNKNDPRIRIDFSCSAPILSERDK